MSFRPIFLALLPLMATQVHAVGLGELRSYPVLGQPLQLEVEILGSPKILDPACFSLRPATIAGDAPNLRQATFRVRKETPPVVEIRSSTALRDPIVQFAVRYSCEQDVVREYVLLALPPEERSTLLDLPAATSPLARAGLLASGDDGGLAVAPRRPGRADAATKPASNRSRQADSSKGSAATGQMRALDVTPARTQGSAQPVAPRRDRLLLSGGAEVGEPGLRFATGLAGDPELVPTAADAERAQLRLEYRVLSLMQEMATTPATAGERLRELDSQLAVLRQQLAPATPAPAAAPAAPPAARPSEVAQSVPAADDGFDFEEYVLYGALVALLLGMLGFLRWRSRREADVLPVAAGPMLAEDDVAPPPVVPARVELAPTAEPIIVAEAQHQDSAPEPFVGFSAAHQGTADDTLEMPQGLLETTFFAEPATPLPSVHEQYEVNPVMELADIMLSFGRVKGAAQALQEYVDKNPQEALQPWIRLLEVYRMAGMRDEFELVARNLNKNFNVEVLQWEDSDSADDGNVIDFVLDDDATATSIAANGPPKARTLEEMPRLMSQVCDQWWEDGVLEQLHLLLRDNRGGQRLGFSLPVVDEILFLIELKETIRTMNLETV